MGNQHGKERRSYGRKIDWEHADRPSPPGKPYLVPETPDQQPDFITIRWSPPASDGGAPIIGYLVEHRRTGSPHWLRASPNLAVDTEFTLTGLEPGWRYQFRVSAENDVGRSDPGELSEPLTVTLQRSAATAPHFNRELQDTIALENEKVEFTVHVIATPPPKISWYKDGFEIFSSRRTKIVTENDQSTLIIHQAALEDEGEIKCTATNRAGHVVTKANLKLEAPPRIRLPRQYEEGLLFEKGEMIRLKVSTAGRPLPRVSWYHNSELLQHGGRYDITDTERNSVLRINEARREDRGEYVIKGTNKIGEDVTSFLVTITDRPLPPGKAQVVMTLGKSVTLSWAAPEDDGGCKIGNFIVEYFRIGWNMWLKAATCRQLTTVLSELIEGSEYKFRVKAENPYGVSDPGEESDVIFIPDPKRGILQPPPRQETEPSDVWLEEAKKRPSEKENEKDAAQEAKRRRLLEENAKKLLDTPLSILLSRENTSPKTIEKPARKNLPSPSTSPKHDRDIESISKQKEAPKRHLDDDENVPPPVPKRKGRSEKQSLIPSVEEPMSVDESSPSPQPFETYNNSKEINQRIRSKSYPLTDDAPSPENRDYLTVSDMYPRENDDSVLHGSSELMLVLLPEERSKSAELSAQHRSQIEISLTESGVAPPMSLSAPELGSGEPLEMPLMRDAVSSTELLHERAMARFYQAVADEEAQKLLKRRYSTERKSAERRISLKDGVLERRHSFKDTILTEKSETKEGARTEDTKLEPNALLKEKSPVSKIPVKKEIKKLEEANLVEIEESSPDEIKKSAIPRLKKESVVSETKPKTILGKEGRLSSVEREQLEFALVRDRIREKNEQNLQPRVLPPRPPNLQQQSSMSSQRSSFDKEEQEQEFEEDEEYVEEEEEEEEDYLEEEEEVEDEEEMEVVEEAKEELMLNDAKYRPKAIVQTPPPVPKHGLPKEPPKIEEKKPRKLERTAPFAEEEDTYHPRSMIPTRSVITKFESPLPVTIEEETKPKQPEFIFNVESPEETKPEEKPEPTSKPETQTINNQKQLDAKEKPNKVDIVSKQPPETPSKIPVTPEKPAKKRTAIMKKIEKLTLKREKKVPAIASLIVDSATPMASVASVVLPKPILKKKLKKDKESSKESDKSKSNKESARADNLEDNEDGKKKKQVRIAEPKDDGLRVPTSNEPKLSPNTLRKQRIQRRQESLEEDEQGNRVLIYHYSDIVREFGGPKKPPPKLYLNYEELKAHAPEEEKTDDKLSLALQSPETENNANASDTEERGSALDMTQVEDVEQNVEESPKARESPIMVKEEPAKMKTPSPSPQPEEPQSSRASSHSPSPDSLRPFTPEEKVRSSVEYMTDVAMFIVACWLYLFKNELYAIPVLCLMVYRQIKDSVTESYHNFKESISNKIPERFKRKKKGNENENENKEGEDDSKEE